MKKLLLAFLLYSGLASAQIGNYPALIGQKGTTPPTKCTIGQLFFDTDATAGSNVYGCTAANTWTLQGGSGTVTGSGTSGQVAFWNGTSSLTGDADLTFNGTTLSATGLTVTNAPTFSALTVGRIPFAGTAGLLGDSSNLQYTDTLVNSAPGIKIGTGNTTSMGIYAGYGGSSGFAGLYNTSVTPGASNYQIAFGTNNLYLQSANSTTGNIFFNNTNSIVTTGGASTLTIAGPISGGGSSSNDAFRINTKMFAHTTAPTVSGGCTGGAGTVVTNSNGTIYATFTNGTGCSGSQPLTITLPAASVGWNCFARNVSNAATSSPAQTGAVSTTSVTITNFVRTTGVAGAWSDSDVVVVSCIGG